jgi:GT2 family glycosyltransferase
MRELLLRCLTTIEESIPTDWRVIVVSNGDSDGTVEATRSQFPWIQLIVNSQNRGVGHARNQGISEASGAVVVLLDADTEVPAGALERLVASLMAEPDVGVVGPRLVSPSGELQYTARTFPTILTKVRRRSPAVLRRILPSDDLVESDGPRSAGYVIGACQAIRRRALDEVGLLDGAVFYGPEDVDLCLRMWKKGWRVSWDPTITIMHHEQRATRRRLFSGLTLRHIIGLGRYFLKHRYVLRAPQFGHEPLDAEGIR